MAYDIHHALGNDGKAGVDRSDHSPLRQREYGALLPSRYPIRGWSNTCFPLYPGCEPRGVVQAELGVPRGDGTFLNSHIRVGRPGGEAGAVIQRHELASVVTEWANEAEHPVVFTGHVNAQPGDADLKPLPATFDDAWSAAVGGSDGFTIPAYPVRAATERIDVILLWPTWHVRSWPVAITADTCFTSDHFSGRRGHW